MENSLFEVSDESYKRMMKYDKFKVFIEVVPIQRKPWNLFKFEVKDNYDFYLVSDSYKRRYFIPTYKTVDHYFNPVYYHEYTVNPTGGADIKKVIPLHNLNTFTKVGQNYPAFCGYFESLDKVNEAYQKMLRDVLLKEIIVRQRIKDEKLINQIKTFHLQRAK